ncbi:MAG: hypothetical protein IJA48_02645, partial [Oscillospiraceae bacterium]|nr:hypothetical protein [Oscillospiraceae bacterium]
PKAYIIARRAISYRRYITRSCQGTDIIEKDRFLSKPVFFLVGEAGLEGVLCKPACPGLPWSSVPYSTPKPTFRRPAAFKLKLQTFHRPSDGTAVMHNWTFFTIISG